MKLIKEKFPLVGGLHDTLMGEMVDFPKELNDSWTQLLHNGSNHWLVITKRPGVSHVEVYDSLGGLPNDHVLACIASLLRPSAKSFSYAVKSCQLQQNGNDCGLFAIANAVTLACNGNPSKTFYDQSKMRSHLMECLRKKEIDPFPLAKGTPDMSESRLPKRMKVYCHCRRTFYYPPSKSSPNSNEGSPWDVIQCQNCKEWFHRQCENWPDKTWGVKWICKTCHGSPTI